MSTGCQVLVVLGLTLLAIAVAIEFWALFVWPVVSQ